MIVLVTVFALIVLPVLLIALTLFLARAVIVFLLFHPLIMFRVALVHKISGIPAIADWLLIVTIPIRTVLFPVITIMQVRPIFIYHHLVTAI